MVLFSLPFVMETCNDRLLHSSFVEPLKSEVKKKISICVAGHTASRHSDEQIRSRRQPHCNLQYDSTEQILPRMRHHSGAQTFTPSG